MQEALGPNFTVLEFDQPTASAAQAATAIGCAVAQIAKSLVFADAKGAPVLVIASGANRVDEVKVGEILGTPIHRADANFVKSATGFSIGGVPPVGHAKRPFVLLDRDLEGFTQIWAAAGTPNAVFKLTPIQLKQLTGGVYYDIKWIEVY
jgi:prolyl-tRNA editing enzyme YbaK/EbsC (Cys-tRNA(Pro) deacylase)